jgi:FkbM family methyltransferase
MRCDISEMLQRQFYFFGTYVLEEDLLHCWEAEAERARIVFDVGANAGIFSLTALAANRNAVVHAFEPTPEIAARLRRTAVENALAQLHVHEAAVAGTDGRATLRRWRGELDSNEGMNFITVPDEPGTELVRTVSLDSFCETHRLGRIDLLKLDIQGQEPLALAGAKQLLAAGRIGTIFCELNWAPRAGERCPATEVIQTLEASGYEFSPPATPLHWRPSGPWLRGLSDVIARVHAAA